jgi:hypothetical protein
MTIVESCAVKPAFLTYEDGPPPDYSCYRGSVGFQQPLPRLRIPVRWMKTPLSRYSSAPLDATKSTKSEYHWIASRTAPKRRRTLILNSFFVKSTIQNATAILKQVLLLIVTASIAFRENRAVGSSGRQMARV